MQHKIDVAVVFFSHHQWMANNFFQHIFLMLQTVIVYIANLILYVANIILWCCDKQVWWWVFPSDVRTISTPCSIISRSDTPQTQYSGPRRHKAGPCAEDMTSSDLYIPSHAFSGAVVWLSRGVVIVVYSLLSLLTVAAALSASSASRDCVKINRQLPKLEGNRAS